MKPKRVKKVTDKMRLDWLQKNFRSHLYKIDVCLSGYLFHNSFYGESYYGSCEFRKAIDTAIRQEKRGNNERD